MRRAGPHRLDGALDGLVRDLTPSTPLAAVQRCWRDVVGDAMAAHATPVAERDGTLVVVCDQAVWASEIDLLQVEVIERLNAALGGVRVRRLRARAGRRADLP